MSRVLVLHGPNLNLLGEREIAIYGTKSLESIDSKLKEMAKRADVAIEVFQSNHEGEIIDKIQSAKGNTDFIIINPGAFTHYSLAIRDAIASVEIPTIEVHLSNIYAREKFRNKSVISPVARGVICGLGEDGYYLALQQAISYMR